jgi:prevent-host-death family protein
MPDTWQLQDAKNRFSEVVERALHRGPQTVTRRGKEAVVVMAAGKYHELTRPKTSLLEFFRQSPLYGVELNLERDRDTGREVDL